MEVKSKRRKMSVVGTEQQQQQQQQQQSVVDESEPEVGDGAVHSSRTLAGIEKVPSLKGQRGHASSLDQDLVLVSQSNGTSDGSILVPNSLTPSGTSAGTLRPSSKSTDTGILVPSSLTPSGTSAGTPRPSSKSTDTSILVPNSLTPSGSVGTKSNRRSPAPSKSKDTLPKHAMLKEIFQKQGVKKKTSSSDRADKNADDTKMDVSGGVAKTGADEKEEKGDLDDLWGSPLRPSQRPGSSPFATAAASGGRSPLSLKKGRPRMQSQRTEEMQEVSASISEAKSQSGGANTPRRHSSAASKPEASAATTPRRFDSPTPGTAFLSARKIKPKTALASSNAESANNDDFSTSSTPPGLSMTDSAVENGLTQTFTAISLRRLAEDLPKPSWSRGKRLKSTADLLWDKTTTSEVVGGSLDGEDPLGEQEEEESKKRYQPVLSEDGFIMAREPPRVKVRIYVMLYVLRMLSHLMHSHRCP